MQIQQTTASLHFCQDDSFIKVHWGYLPMTSASAYIEAWGRQVKRYADVKFVSKFGQCGCRVYRLIRIFWGRHLCNAQSRTPGQSETNCGCTDQHQKLHPAVSRIADFKASVMFHSSLTSVILALMASSIQTRRVRKLQLGLLARQFYDLNLYDFQPYIWLSGATIYECNRNGTSMST